GRVRRRQRTRRVARDPGQPDVPVVVHGVPPRRSEDRGRVLAVHRRVRAQGRWRLARSLGPPAEAVHAGEFGRDHAGCDPCGHRGARRAGDPELLIGRGRRPGPADAAGRLHSIVANCRCRRRTDGQHRPQPLSSAPPCGPGSRSSETTMQVRVLLPVAIAIAGALAAQSNTVPGLDGRLTNNDGPTLLGRRGAAFPNGEVGMSYSYTMCNAGTVPIPWT